MACSKSHSLLQVTHIQSSSTLDMVVTLLDIYVCISYTAVLLILCSKGCRDSWFGPLWCLVTVTFRQS